MARFPIANPELRSTASVNGMLPTHADALGRTQVVGTSSVQAPALKQFVSVTDKPWGAAGDSKRVTDGAITNGQFTLSSVTAAFTTADVGKRVDVVGAGASAHVLVTTISSVSSGVATLAASASATVSGATVTYGTDDTTAFQNAHNAVSAGGGRLLVPGGSNYLVGKVAMKSNTVIDARGATLHMQSTAGSCGFSTFGGSAANNWTILGANFQGDGATLFTDTRICVYVNIAGSSDIRVEDCTFQNIPDCVIEVHAARCWIVNNRLDTLTSSTGRNAINMEATTNNGVATDINCHGNVLTNITIQGIHIGSNPGDNIVGQEVRFTITANKTIGTGITAELGDAGGGFGMGSVVIANNVVSGPNIGIGGGNGTTQSEFFRWLVQGNVVNTSAGFGISINADWVTCTGNVIEQTGTGGGINTLRSGNTLTGTTDGSTAVITAVTFPSGSQHQPVVGSLVSGTGITAGSYIVSINIGASTITINQATTAANAGVTIGFTWGAFGVNIVGNTIHCPTTGTTNASGINCTALKYSNVSNNVVYFDPGSPSASFYALQATNCWNTTFDNNTLENSPRYGAFFQNCHDCYFTRNKIHNPNQNGVATQAIGYQGCWNIFFDDNSIIDDTGASKITQAIQQSGGTNGGLRFRRNTIVGATNTLPIATPANFVEIRGNTVPSGSNNPAIHNTISPSASPFTYTNVDPYPETVLIQGGTVSTVQFTKNNATPTAFNVGTTAGMFYLDLGDALTVTYTVVPAMKKFPQA